MERIEISYDHNQEKAYRETVQRKIDAFQSTYEFLRENGYRVRKQALYDDILTEFQRAFYVKHDEPFLKTLSFDKAVDLFDIDIDLIHKNTELFNQIPYEFNPINYEYSIPDFNVYAEDDESIERYKRITEFNLALERLNEVRFIDRNLIIQAVRGALILDIEDNRRLTANTNVVLGLM